MSYSSLKRVLGETKLELKTLVLFGVCLLTLIAASFYWYGHRIEQEVYEQMQQRGRGLVNSILTNVHAVLFEHDKTKKSDLQEMLSGWPDDKYRWSFIVARPIDDKWLPHDEFESGILEEFKRIPIHSSEEDSSAKQYRYRRMPEKEELHYYQPIWALTDNCTICHNSYEGRGPGNLFETRPPYKKGDLIAVAKVVISDKETQRALALNNAILWATAIITVFLAIVASYLIIRYVIVKPLKHLRDVSDEVSRGNMSLRAEIQTGDEFEDLAVAFNRMLRHMIDAQDKLRDVNGSLDAKVDELAQANMQLYEMNRLKSDFLATMSHELRTPLNSIIGFSDVLGSIASLDDKQRRYVLNIQKSGRVLLDMINDILDLAKIESGKMEVRLSEFRLEHLIHAQCDMAKPLTERKNIDLDVELASNLPPLFQDQGKVQQILNNLLSNAIKFTPEGGRIVVRAKLDESEQIQVAVEDTGIGIAEEDQTAIFEKFRQGSAVLSGGDAITREYSGTGLGLSIVRELCKLLGGEVTLVSHLGQGSTFTVHLPISRAPSAAKLELPAAPEADLIQPRRIESSELQPVSSRAEN